MNLLHSYFSLRYGTFSLEQVIKKAQKYQLHELVLADINNSTGMLDFVKICKQNQIKPIAGIDFFDGDTHLYTGIAKNNKGFQELNEFLTLYNLSKQKLPYTAPDFKHVFIIYPFRKPLTHELKAYEYIGISVDNIAQLSFSKYKYNQNKFVICQPVTFLDNSGYILHKHLRAIDKNILLSQLKSEYLASNSEMLYSTKVLEDIFTQFPEIIKNTKELFALCNIDFDYKSIKNKKTFTGSLFDDKLLLKKLAFDGLKYRYGTKNLKAQARVEKELDIIVKLGFAAYFLITWDMIRYSMSRGFYHVGRGSGANSIVAYCLKITDVDPIELDLYFERFLNPKRTSPPDFDIDYSWKDRDDVQDYLFKRYGQKHTALLGAMSTFKGRSIYRELGKVYGLPKSEIDVLVNDPGANINKNEVTKEIIFLGKKMIDFPNLRTIHAGGILISEEPICYYTALDLPPKGFPTTQWDMYVAEDIGFEKLDVLSQRGIGHIKETVEIVKENCGISVDVHNVAMFKQDKKVQNLLKIGETNGCFYIESPAMRGLLKKLHCSDYLTLVAASSIIRPGVARSGMMREYIYRFHNPKKFRYIHPVLKMQLKETYGVMVYQEDVLKVCHHFAGLDLDDADILRRAMSGKFRSRVEFQRIVNKFFDNCRKKAYPESIIKEVWRQIESFAGYSFSKAHSASYAVESFQSLYLKAYFPLEFMVAVINNFGGFYRTWVYFNEAKRWGAQIMLPCVNNSNYKTRIIKKKIYIGFVHIINFESKLAYQIENERLRNGVFVNLDDFIVRIQPGMEQLIILIRIGAFSFTKKNKAQLLWEAHMLLGKKPKKVNNMLLFNIPRRNFELPELVYNKMKNAYDELEFLGFPVTLNYFDLLQTNFRGAVFVKDITNFVGKKVRMIGLLVTIKYVSTVRKEIMHFGTFIDINGEFFDTVHFPNSLKKYPFRGYGVYLLLGKIVSEFGFPSMEVEKMAKLPQKPDPRNK